MSLLHSANDDGIAQACNPPNELYEVEVEVNLRPTVSQILSFSSKLCFFGIKQPNSAGFSARNVVVNI
jgi:hypothetical protein